MGDWFETIVTGLVLAAIVSLLKMWKVQGEVVKDVERMQSDIDKLADTVDRVSRDGARETTELRKSISDLLLVNREQTVQIQHMREESDRHTRMHTTHFDTAAKLQRQIDAIQAPPPPPTG